MITSYRNIKVKWSHHELIIRRLIHHGKLAGWLFDVGRNQYGLLPYEVSIHLDRE